jgi:hypothetical protein
MEISEITGSPSSQDFGESKTKMILLRTRNKLKEYLEKEGVEL